MLSIKQAAPLVLPDGGTGRTLQKRIKNSITTTAGRARWEALSIDPDDVSFGVNDEFTLVMANILDLDYPNGVEEVIDQPSPQVKKEVVKRTYPARPLPSPRAKRPKAKKVEENKSMAVPDWLVASLVACAPIAEGYSFARIGFLNYGLGIYGQAGWAFIGYVAGLIVFVNYVRVEDQTRAELWAGTLAVLQLLTHLSASGWNWTTATASVLIVACSWAINAAYRRK